MMEQIHYYLVAIFIVTASHPFGLRFTEAELQTSLVPDNEVWTPPTTTLWLRQPNSVITCSFRGKPFAVYWMKGPRLGEAESILTFNQGTRSGSLYEDGSVEFGSGDYSLVFRRTVIQSDEGRYFCRVSNYNGYLVHNYTDVKVLDPDHVNIYTAPNVTKWRGAYVSLPCDFAGTPEQVLWNHESSQSKLSSVETVLRYTVNGYEVLGNRGRYGWSYGFSLVIRDVSVLDEGRFICQVRKLDGIDIENGTLLTVNALADEPYIRIKQCEGESQSKADSSSTSHRCAYSVTDDTDQFTLDCSVIGAKPAVNVTWTGDVKENGSSVSTQRRRDDGRSDSIGIVTVKTPDSPGSYVFTCSAEGEAVNGSASQTMQVNIVKVPVKMSPAAIVIPLLLCIIMILCLFLIWRIKKHPPPQDLQINMCSSHAPISADDETEGETRKAKLKPWLLQIFGCQKKQKESGADLERQPLSTSALEKKREEIKSYEPGQASGNEIETEVINIGLFGVISAGKSTLINSLKFALEGEYKQVTIEAGQTIGGSGTLNRESVPLTQHINILDNRGMKDFKKGQIVEFMAQIRGERGLNPADKVTNGTEIHCPVVVCNLRNAAERQYLLDFINKFSKEVYKHFGRPVLVVITNKDSLENPDDEIENIKLATDVPLPHIRAFENYTENSHDHDDQRSLELLDLIAKCIAVAESNITFRKKKEGESHVTTHKTCRLM